MFCKDAAGFRMHGDMKNPTLQEEVSSAMWDFVLLYVVC